MKSFIFLLVITLMFSCHKKDDESNNPQCTNASGAVVSCCKDASGNTIACPDANSYSITIFNNTSANFTVEYNIGGVTKINLSGHSTFTNNHSFDSSSPNSINVKVYNSNNAYNFTWSNSENKTYTIN